ncbi:MAG: nickel-binding protein [Candidatus Geothermarchaeales archaeon]
MPVFLDSHDLKGADEAALRQLQEAPRDEFGVLHKNILFNRAEDKGWCLLDAPSKEAVEKHHAKLGYTCNWITEVETTA